MNPNDIRELVPHAPQRDLRAGETAEALGRSEGNASVPLGQHPAHFDSATARELVSEHGALTRLLAGLQRRMGQLLRTHALQVQALESEILRLRAQLVVVRTGLLWGLPQGWHLAGTVRPATVAPPPAAAAAPALPKDPALREASAVICQTGCTGHAHPWLEVDGQCRRTGQGCDRRSKPP